MSDPKVPDRIPEHHVIVSPAMVLSAAEAAAKARIDEIRSDKRLAVEETVLQSPSLRVSLGLQMVRREIMSSGTTLFQQVRGQGVTTLSTFLILADLKERVKAGQIEIDRISLDKNQRDLSQKCISITTNDGHRFTVYNLTNEVLAIMVEENQAELFS